MRRWSALSPSQKLVFSVSSVQSCLRSFLILSNRPDTTKTIKPPMMSRKIKKSSSFIPSALIIKAEAIREKQRIMPINPLPEIGIYRCRPHCHLRRHFGIKAITVKRMARPKNKPAPPKQFTAVSCPDPNEFSPLKNKDCFKLPIGMKSILF